MAPTCAACCADHFILLPLHPCLTVTAGAHSAVLPRRSAGHEGVAAAVAGGWPHVRAAPAVAGHVAAAQLLTQQPRLAHEWWRVHPDEGVYARAVGARSGHLGPQLCSLLFQVGHPAIFIIFG
jgi:hypothetical protein